MSEEGQEPTLEEGPVAWMDRLRAPRPYRIYTRIYT